MPDIAMCKNIRCPVRFTCYRFNAEPDVYQSYGEFEFINNNCQFYWPMEPEQL